MQQQLLQQHSQLTGKARVLLAAIEEDVRALARLWQLQAKMRSVGDAYDARLSQVMAARALVQEQLCQRLQLLEGYSRVGSMIEIEVEMNSEARCPPPSRLRSARRPSRRHLLCSPNDMCG